MTAPTESYKKVFYDLRPAKQIERRMMFDTFQAMAEVGVPISDYQYTGMGSIFFVDFLLFHRWLGLSKLLSVEHDTRIEKRVMFNRPFDCVEVAMAPVGDVIPTLRSDGRHILWLDYDDRLNSAMLQDVVLAAQTLSAGSMLFITLDISPPAGSGPTEWRTYFEREGGDYAPFETSLDRFAKTALPMTNAEILSNALRQGVAGRTGVLYRPLFAFAYADGCPMLTVGGMLAGADDNQKIDLLDPAELPFLRLASNDPPYEIDVPVLTRRERLYLDQNMPCPPGWNPSAFEMSPDELEQYRKVYRYYPIYGELIY